MPFLPRPLIQVLVFWVMGQMRAGRTNEEIMQSRGQIVSFVLFWYLCVSLDPNRASKECITQIMRTPEDANFPGHTLYSMLTETDESVKKHASALPMFPVKIVEGIFEVSPSGQARSFTEKFNKLSNSGPEKNEAEIRKQEQTNNLCRQVISRFWGKKDLLLWLQRTYLSRRFETYDALAGKEDEETVPYDYDHLCPCDEWGAYSNKIENRSPEPGLSTKNRVAFMNNRSEIGNGIGNYHILHFADNRSINNAGFSEKLRLLEEGSWRLTDGALPVEDKTLWDKTSNNDNKYCWTDERIKCWQEAVDHKFMHLYGSILRLLRKFSGTRDVAVRPEYSSNGDLCPDVVELEAERAGSPRIRFGRMDAANSSGAHRGQVQPFSPPGTCDGCNAVSGRTIAPRGGFAGRPSHDCSAKIVRNGVRKPADEQRGRRRTGQISDAVCWHESRTLDNVRERNSPCISCARRFARLRGLCGERRVPAKTVSDAAPQAERT